MSKDLQIGLLKGISIATCHQMATFFLGPVRQQHLILFSHFLLYFKGEMALTIVKVRLEMQRRNLIPDSSSLPLLEPPFGFKTKVSDLEVLVSQ